LSAKLLLQRSFEGKTRGTQRSISGIIYQGNTPKKGVEKMIIFVQKTGHWSAKGGM
jgi:hypothetical protein